MRIQVSAIALVAACTAGREASPGPAARLASGASDTVIVNHRRPMPLPIRAVDAAGRDIPEAPIRYEWASGARLPVSATGEVRCTQVGDFTVRAILDSLTARIVVRCRPVEYVRLPGPIQFILGDTALSRPRALAVEAYDMHGRPVALFAGGAHVIDSGVAALRGLTLHPRSRGITLVGARVGDRSAVMGLHIYQRVGTLAALDTLLRVPPEQRLFAVPLRLERGEFHRQRLPPGEWMLAMLPEEDTDPTRIHLRVEGAHCDPNFLNAPRRFGCHVGPDGVVTVYRPFGGRTASVATGYLLVRWMFP